MSRGPRVLADGVNVIDLFHLLEIYVKHRRLPKLLTRLFVRFFNSPEKVRFPERHDAVIRFARLFAQRLNRQWTRLQERRAIMLIEMRPMQQASDNFGYPQKQGILERLIRLERKGEMNRQQPPIPRIRPVF